MSTTTTTLLLAVSMMTYAHVSFGIALTAVFPVMASAWQVFLSSTLENVVVPMLAVVNVGSGERMTSRAVYECSVTSL